MADMTREELAAMTDQEVLAYEREHHGDPYMTLLKAKGCSGWPCGSGILGRPGRRRTGRPRRRRGVAFIRSCFRPTPLLSLSQRGGADGKSAGTVLVPVTSPTR